MSNGVDRRAILARSWQWSNHVERLRKPGQYVAGEVAGMPIVMVRDADGVLRVWLTTASIVEPDTIERSPRNCEWISFAPATRNAA